MGGGSGLIEAAKGEDVALRDVDRARGAEDVLVVRLEGAVDGQRAAVEVHHRETGADRTAQVGVGADDEITGIEAPGGAHQGQRRIDAAGGVAVDLQDAGAALDEQGAVAASVGLAVDVAIDADDALLRGDVEETRAGVLRARISVSHRDVVTRTEELEIAATFESVIETGGERRAAASELKRVHDRQVLARGADGAHTVVGAVRTSGAEGDGAGTERSGQDDGGRGRAGPERITRQGKTHVLDADDAGIVVRGEAVDAAEDAHGTGVLVIGVRIAETDSGAAGDVAGDVERADRGTVDGTELGETTCDSRQLDRA